METPKDLRYTDNDEWIRVEGNMGTIGITDFAQDQLSDIVYVEIVVAEGYEISKGDSCATIESVKAVSDLFYPATGEVIEVNVDLKDGPQLVNEDCYGKGWMFKIKPADMAEINTLIHGPEEIEKWLLADIEKYKQD